MSKYWKEREFNHIRKAKRDDKEITKYIDEHYKNAYDSITAEIDGYFGRYSADEGISLRNAKKRVSTMDVEKFSRKAKRYVKEFDFSSAANKELRIYNLTMKVNRLEYLKSQIGLELTKNSSQVEQWMYKMLSESAEKEVLRQAGILGINLKLNKKAIEKIVNASFYDAKFSVRIWHNQDLLKARIDEALTKYLTRGKTTRELIEKLKKEFHASEYEAKRLAVTERRRIATDVMKESFKEAGFTYYDYVGEYKACPVCKDTERKSPYKLDNLEIGVNAPPMHPNCRCSMIASLKED